MSDPTIETVWCSCSLNNENFLFGCIQPGDASDEGNRQINRALDQANKLVKKRNFSGYYKNTKQLTYLRRLNLRRNTLFGSIPEEIGFLSNLTSIVLGFVVYFLLL